METITGPRYTDVTINKSNLYREETFTDLNYAQIRKLTPVHADGTEDNSRSVIFTGMVQLMSPSGPIPIHCVISEANTLDEAANMLPDAVERTVRDMINEAQQEPKIVIPGE
ncbi:MAG: hypothetical protein N2572_00960 [Syntrophales bacterium]|nr:hypothetical protein [Syntrophales bacterium]